MPGFGFRNGLVYAMPWEALDWQPIDETGRGAFRAPFSAAELAEAPKLDRASARSLENPRALARTYRFYGLEQPKGSKLEPVLVHSAQS